MSFTGAGWTAAAYVLRVQERADHPARRVRVATGRAGVRQAGGPQDRRAAWSAGLRPVGPENEKTPPQRGFRSGRSRIRTWDLFLITGILVSPGVRRRVRWRSGTGSLRTERAWRAVPIRPISGPRHHLRTRPDSPLTDHVESLVRLVEPAGTHSAEWPRALTWIFPAASSAMTSKFPRGTA